MNFLSSKLRLANNPRRSCHNLDVNVLCSVGNCHRKQQDCAKKGEHGSKNDTMGILMQYLSISRQIVIVFLCANYARISDARGTRQMREPGGLTPRYRAPLIKYTKITFHKTGKGA